MHHCHNSFEALAFVRMIFNDELMYIGRDYSWINTLFKNISSTNIDMESYDTLNDQIANFHQQPTVIAKVLL